MFWKRLFQPKKKVVSKKPAVTSAAGIQTTAYDLAMRYVGVKEVPGTKDNPIVLSMLRLDSKWPEHDEVPWCSGFMNWIAWHLRLPRSKSLMARSWLNVGKPVSLSDAEPGFDVVILWRGNPDGPSGHVGLYAGTGSGTIKILGGNQGNAVTISEYPKNRLLGIRRIYG